MSNCKNCGAPYFKNKCPYCNTVAKIDAIGIGKDAPTESNNLNLKIFDIVSDPSCENAIMYSDLLAKQLQTSINYSDYLANLLN